MKGIVERVPLCELHQKKRSPCKGKRLGKPQSIKIAFHNWKAL